MKKQIPSKEKAFLTRVADIMFSNPFDHDVGELEQLTGLTLDRDCEDHFYVLLKPQLEVCMSALAECGVTSIEGLTGEDKHILTAAGLFIIFDRYIDQFDALISEQLQKPEADLKVDFYKDAMVDIGNMGFDGEHSARYFALFYQLRRAYTFINHELTGQAECIRRLRRDLWNNIFTSDALLYIENLWNRMEDFSTLLLGETGTGKGAAARAIGRSGLIPFDLSSGHFKTRFTESFVSINLLEFPESLLESELFGHTKGSFTGATSNYDGLFKRCDANGALFLDEIGDVNTSIQIKLLKVLQERRYSPVGGHEPCRFSGRVIAATNRDLTELRESGEFRDDFYYRLSSDVIEIPSLRERLSQDSNELSVLVSSLMERLIGHKVPKMVSKVLDALERNIPADYHWPGNVRELEQAVRRTILGRTYTGETKRMSALPEWLSQAADGRLSANALLSEYCKMLYERSGTFEGVASATGLDRRTVKKHITSAEDS